MGIGHFGQGLSQRAARHRFDLGTAPQLQAPSQGRGHAAHGKQRHCRTPGLRHLPEPAIDGDPLVREAFEQTLPVCRFRVLDAELQARQAHDVVGVAARREGQLVIAQPGQQAAELAVGSWKRPDTPM